MRRLGVDRLVAFRGGGGIHPFWHLEVELDATEMVANRRRQRAYLARYARCDWDAPMSVIEIARRVRLVSEIVQQENKPTNNQGE